MPDGRVAPDDVRTAIFAAITAERAAQDAKHGGAAHDQTHHPLEWINLITQHALYAGSPYSVKRFRQQMIRVAALAVAALEASMSQEEQA